MDAQLRESIIRDEALKAAHADDPIKASERVIAIIDRHHELLEQEKMLELVNEIEKQPKHRSRNEAVKRKDHNGKVRFWDRHLNNSHKNYLTMRSSH